MKEKIKEALQLAEEILKNVELSEIPLRNVALKCARLARLLDKTKAIEFFQYEIAGYPTDDAGYVLAEAFQLARFGNRTFKQKDKFGKIQEYMFPETVAVLESELDAAKEQMKVAFDRDVSVQSSNPEQYVFSPVGNVLERTTLKQIIIEKSKKIDQVKVSYYKFILDIIYELKFTNLAEDIFSKKKISVEKILGDKIPESLQKFLSVYENLQSKNPEDWANAVHSCRRLIKDVADQLYPPSDKTLKLDDGKSIPLNEDHYIMRLKEYIKSKTNSTQFQSVVGSHLDYVGERIDSIYKASNKGTHTKVDKEEAERYVIYAYLMLSDILSL